MLLSHFKRLCVLLPTLITATPQNPSPSSTITSLPARLQSAVPACAQPCVQDSLRELFPSSCSGATEENFRCLCSTYSFAGEALGEVALKCIYASCAAVDTIAASAYNVCLGQRDAVLATQTALTVVPASSILSKIQATRTPVVTTTKSTSTFTTITKSQNTPTDTVVANSFPSTTQSSSTSSGPTATAAAMAAEDQKAPAMKPAQIAGLSVAAAATFIVAIGLMVLSVFLRRRRERRRAAGGIEEGKGSTDAQRPRKSFFQRSSKQGFDKMHSPQIAFPEKKPPPRFPYPAPQTSDAGSSPSRTSPYSDASLAQTNPKTSAYSIPPGTDMPRSPPQDPRLMHPALRPGAGMRNNSSNASLPLSQIGVAISAELPANPAAGRRPLQVPRKAELRQPRPKSLRPMSTMTQDTVFEEDAPPERRRSSTLLPTPPIPIPPIRSFQPSRPPPALKLVTQPSRSSPQGQPVSQQPGLSLNIPVRHSRFQPTQVAPASVSSLAPAIVLRDPAPNYPARSSSLYDQHKSISTTVSTPGRNIRPHVPDYHYNSLNTTSPKFLSPGLSPFSKPKESPKLVGVKPKGSSSTLSHPPSRGSTPNVRDSISSQTSFESMDSNDTTPDDEDKQLEESRLSPVAESPISNLRYPKVPRASNQLVPRSPRSPQSPRSDHSLHDLPEPSALLVKRRGEKEALRLESRLHMGSPPSTEQTRQARSHLRSSSVEDYNLANQTGFTSKSRAKSGQWPKSPAMYEMNEVRPLNIRAKEPPTPGLNSLKSPAWVPNLTPTRRGDDLLISVTYSPPPPPVNRR